MGTTAIIAVDGAPATSWYPYGKLLADWSADFGTSTSPNASSPGGTGITRWDPLVNNTGQDMALSVTSAVPPGHSVIDGRKVLRFNAAHWIGSPLFTAPITAPLTVIAAIYDGSATNSGFVFTGYNPSGYSGFVSLQQPEEGTNRSEVASATGGGQSVFSPSPPRASAWGVIAVTVNPGGMFVVNNAGQVTSYTGATSGSTLNGITLGYTSGRASGTPWSGRLAHLRVLSGEMTPAATKARIQEVRSLTGL